MAYFKTVGIPDKSCENYELRRLLSKVFEYKAPFPLIIFYA